MSESAPNGCNIAVRALRLKSHGTGCKLRGHHPRKKLWVRLGARPKEIVTTLIIGARSGDLAADTAAAGDFDGDGSDDLAIASPHFDPPGRDSAGAYHVLHGRRGRWPETVDLASLPDPSLVRTTEIYGAQVTSVASRHRHVPLGRAANRISLGPGQLALDGGGHSSNERPGRNLEPDAHQRLSGDDRRPA